VARADEVKPPPVAAPDEGSTLVARRESRRRHERAGAAQVDRAGRDAPAGGETAEALATERVGAAHLTDALDVPASVFRVARVPEPAPAGAAPTRAAPVVVPRAAAPIRDPQPVIDVAAEEAAARRRTRRAAAAVVVTAAVLALAAAGALLALTITG
jgi:hypothetical protein